MDTSYLFRCSIQKDYKFPYNLTEYFNGASVEKISSESKAMRLGTVTGILITLIIHVLLSFQYRRPSGLASGLFKIFSAKTVSRTLALTLVLLISPIVFIFLFLVLGYKVLCSVIIRRNDKHYVGFLDSFDVFWSLEDDATKSIINVLGIIEADSPHAIANNIKEKLLIIISNDRTRKIFYRRGEEFGFYYWKDYNYIDMDQYVEVIELPDADSLGVKDLENFMSCLQDQPLPYEDEGLFKIIITRQRIGHHYDLKGDYGIIFRIHHSVGDGVALIEFLCKSFADKNDNCPVNMFSMPENYNHDSPWDLIAMMRTLINIPVCFVDGIVRKPDENSLHGPTLTGKKLFKWTQSDENLLKIVKDIKDSVLLQINFTDVLLTALSNGLRDILSETESVPEQVAVVLPVRFPKTSKMENDPILKNDFSVTILDLPVKASHCVKEINNRCNELRKSADPLTNYYFLKLVCSILPKSTLQPLLNSSQASLVFSNMPGPDRLSLCGGNVLKSLVFFVPHKGTTGLGVTALCYGGVLNFATMADEAVVSDPEVLDMLLNGMVHELHRLHQTYVV